MQRKTKIKSKLTHPERIKSWEKYIQTILGWDSQKLNYQIMLIMDKFDGKYRQFITDCYRAGEVAQLYKWYWKRIEAKVKAKGLLG